MLSFNENANPATANVSLLSTDSPLKLQSTTDENLRLQREVVRLKNAGADLRPNADPSKHEADELRTYLCRSETAVQDMVALNVGGAHFVTRRETLLRQNSFFSGLLEECRPTHTGTIFIDRDPAQFRHILNYLRGTSTFPPSVSALLELCGEAEFYCLDGLKEEALVKLNECRAENTNVACQLSKIAAKINNCQG